MEKEQWNTVKLVNLDIFYQEGIRVFMKQSGLYPLNKAVGGYTFSENDLYIEFKIELIYLKENGSAQGFGSTHHYKTDISLTEFSMCVWRDLNGMFDAMVKRLDFKAIIVYDKPILSLLMDEGFDLLQKVRIFYDSRESK